MKKILLTQGKHALVDDEDFDYLSQWKWCLSRGYAVRSKSFSGPKRVRGMHRLIMKTPDNLYTDHINRNRLDNRKSNLRICTPKQNAYNRSIQSNNRSGYIGVVWEARRNKWRAQVKVNGRKKTIGRFIAIKDAISARDSYARDVFGEFASLNRRI